MHNLPTFKLPALYTLALMQMAQHTGEKPETLLTRALNLLFNADNPPTDTSPHKTDPVSPENQTILISLSQLSVIPNPSDNTPHICVEQDVGCYWLENKSHTNLAKALSKIREYGETGHINLKDWEPLSDNYPLVILQKPNGLAHIWLGQNSACKVFNNKDVKPDSFKLSTEFPTHNICKSCVNNYKKLSSPKVQLSFDSKKRLLPLSIQSFDPSF
ncbi:hypothetical protein [Acinetobacter brisouii]